MDDGIEGYGDECSIWDPEEEQDDVEDLACFQIPGRRPKPRGMGWMVWRRKRLLGSRVR